MTTERDEAELWIETRTCEIRLDCELAQYHIHVGDQLFWTLDEVRETYGRDLPFKGAEKKWVPLGHSDHKSHVHVSLTGLPPLMPGTVFTGPVGSPQSNHTPVGRAIDINFTTAPEDMSNDKILGLAAVARWLGIPPSPLGPITNPGA